MSYFLTSRSVDSLANNNFIYIVVQVDGSGSKSSPEELWGDSAVSENDLYIIYRQPMP